MLTPKHGNEVSWFTLCTFSDRSYYFYLLISSTIFSNVAFFKTLNNMTKLIL